MVYSLTGKLIIKKPQLAVIETNGIGFKMIISSKTFSRLPKINEKIRLFCYTNVRQDGIELYGFLDEKELEIFEMLNSISGIGPKIAMKFLSAAKIDSLLTAISHGRHDLLTKSGIGQKTAERLVLELRDKLKNKLNEEALVFMETDIDIEKALKNLGYQQNEIRETLKNLPPKIKKIEERLKAALQILNKNV